MLDEIKKELIESEISAYDLRIVLDIIRKYEPSVQQNLSEFPTD